MNDTQNQVVAPVATDPSTPVVAANPAPVVVPGPDPISAPVPMPEAVPAPVENVVVPAEATPAPMPVDQVVTDIKVELPQVPGTTDSATQTV